MLNLISNDIKKIVNERKLNINEQKELTQQKNAVDVSAKFTEELNTLKELVKTHINYDDINLIMEDIKESFETYINATPRGISDELTQKIIELDERISLLQSAFDNQPRMEIIETVLPVKRNIPKLSIVKKTKYNYIMI